MGKKEFLFLIFFIGLFINKTNAFSQDRKAFRTFLPEASGDYKIGTSHFWLSDTARAENFTHKKRDFRRIYIKAWYPSDISNKDTAKYISEKKNVTLSAHFCFMGATPKYFKKLSNAKTNSCFDVPVSQKKEKFPVIIFSHGYGISLPEFYSTTMENLAGNGYVVFAIGHAYESIKLIYPDGSNTGRGNVKNLMKFIFELKPLRKANKKIKTEKNRIELINKIKKKCDFIQKSQKEWVEDTKFVIDKIEKPGSFNWRILKNHCCPIKIKFK